MRKQNLTLYGFLITWSCFSVGCMVWPVMTDGHGYRPIAMGKSDQIMWPTAPHPTVLGENYGESVRQIMSAQIANPQASENLSIIEKFDGKAANLAMDRYRKFFKKPPYQRQQASSTAGSSTAGS